MTKAEIIKSRNIELEVAPEGQKFNMLNGEELKTRVKSVLWYSRNKWIGANGVVSLDFLFFTAVKKGYIDIPTDYDTCSKCGGTGNVGFNVDNGTCWKCSGFGYIKKLK